MVLGGLPANASAAESVGTYGRITSDVGFAQALILYIVCEFLNQICRGDEH
jgi:hypothetical protein